MTWSVQVSESPMITDIEGVNLGATDIAAGLVVVLDATNALSSSNTNSYAVAVTLPFSGNGVDIPMGVTMEILKAGGPSGRVRPYGIAPCTANGAIAAGNVVMTDNATGKVLAQTAAKAQVGLALTNAASGDPVAVLVSIAKNA